MYLGKKRESLDVRFGSDHGNYVRNQGKSEEKMDMVAGEMYLEDLSGLELIQINGVRKDQILRAAKVQPEFYRNSTRYELDGLRRSRVSQFVAESLASCSLANF